MNSNSVSEILLSDRRNSIVKRRKAKEDKATKGDIREALITRSAVE